MEIVYDGPVEKGGRRLPLAFVSMEAAELLPLTDKDPFFVVRYASYTPATQSVMKGRFRLHIEAEPGHWLASDRRSERGYAACGMNDMEPYFVEPGEAVELCRKCGEILFQHRRSALTAERVRREFDHWKLSTRGEIEQRVKVLERENDELRSKVRTYENFLRRALHERLEMGGDELDLGAEIHRSVYG